MLITILAIVVMVISACTSKPEIKMPEASTMHYPAQLSLSPEQDTLLVASRNVDGQYDAARMLGISILDINKSLTGDDPKEPIAFAKVVKANVMIPSDIGGLVMTKQHIALVSRSNNKLINLARPLCDKPQNYIDACPNQYSLDLDDDPYAIAPINDDYMMVSYLMSSKVNIIKQDQGLKLIKTLDLWPWLKDKKPQHKFDKKIIGVNHLFISNINDPDKSKIYIIINEMDKHATSSIYSQHSYLLSIDSKHVLSPNAITNDMISLSDLTDKYGIVAAKEMIIDEARNQAYILAQVPETLYMIDLASDHLNKTAITCHGAMSLTKGNDVMILPCFTDNMITMYSLDLDMLATSSYAREPSSCVIDDKHKLIFCTISGDGILAIYDHKLKRLGYVFNKAPLNRLGS